MSCSTEQKQEVLLKAQVYKEKEKENDNEDSTIVNEPLHTEVKVIATEKPALLSSLTKVIITIIKNADFFFFSLSKQQEIYKKKKK